MSLIDWIAIASIFIGWILTILWFYNKTFDVGIAFFELLDDLLIHIRANHLVAN